jgi:transcriptional regulator with XRE-family HTH domain
MQKTTIKNDKRLYKLKYWREFVGLKQEDMAVLLGCKTSNYCQKERGNTEIRLSEILKIHKVINQRLANLGEPQITLDELIR